MSSMPHGSRSTALIRSLMTLIVVTVVLPVVLATVSERRFGGSAPWQGLPSPASWRLGGLPDAITDRLTERVVADIVIRGTLMVAWFAIALFSITVIAESAHMIRHGGLARPDIRGLGWSQRSARMVAAGLLVVLPMFASPARGLAGPDRGLVAHGRAAVAHVLESTDPGTASDVPSTPPTPPSNGLPVAVADHYVVAVGDSVFGIAHRFAGPDTIAIADFAERIVDLNLGRDMGNGERFTNAGYIDIGWVLQLPGGRSTSVDAAEESAEGTHHVVETGESLWSIALDELGDGKRWPEIFDLNVGRDFDDGRVLSDPSILQPGWELEVPVATLDTPAEAIVDARAGGRSGRVGLSSDARHGESRRPSRRADVTERRRGVSRPNRRSRARHRSTCRAGRAREPLGRPRPDADSGAHVRPGGRHRWHRFTRHADASDVGDLITMRRAAMLSAGVLAVLAVRRRRRLRQAEPHARLPEPTVRQTMTERELRCSGPGERLARVDLAVRAAAMSLITDERRVLAVLCSPEGEIELVSDGPTALPAPWKGCGDRWSLAASVPLEALAVEARKVGAPCPTLVQLGVDDHGREVHVDLEAIGTLEVAGPASKADAIVAAIAATLAGSVLAEVTTLVSVDVTADVFLGHRLHVTANDVDHAFDIAGAAVGSTKAMPASTFELRARHTSGETWEPAVVLLGSGLGQVVAPSERAGLAIISASPIIGPSSRLAPDEGAWMLRPAGLRLRPIGLVPDDIAAISELVEAAPPVVAATRPSRLFLDPVAEDSDRTIYTDDDVGPSPNADAPTESEAPETAAIEWDLAVKLIGPVEVVDRHGNPGVFERSKTTELIAWLATHRDRATRSNARTALWEQDVRDATFANVVSEARRSLARLSPPPPGEEWVGRTLTDSLPLHSRVVTDADLLEHALIASRSQPPAVAIATLRPAVDSIAGLPFEGTSYLWPDGEGLTSHLILLATSAASELASHCLAAGDIDGVFQATGRGLRVLPGHEELIGLRMRAHARAGDHAGVRQEWNSYERVINADPWSDGEPSPKLVGLRKQLLHPSM